MSRKRKSHSPLEDELPDEFFELEELEPWWREEGTIYNFPKDYGLTGICFLFYKKPMTSLNNGLVHLKTQQDVDDMLEWTKGIKKIGIYVTHPSRKLAKSLILGEMYVDFKRKWPKATFKEIGDEKVMLLGYRGDGGSKKDEGDKETNVFGNAEDSVEGVEVQGPNVQEPDDVVPYASEVVGDDVERPEVQGPQV
ncbi:hypothetical protein LIER_11057 [Lithospermum erythrorhizon]|uniref:Uncharacterized protein n=1 Tax=Lithospermum erythrorhizon TaxID=34254 RepID=A0AAV3PN08_LITER